MSIYRLTRQPTLLEDLNESPSYCTPSPATTFRVFDKIPQKLNTLQNLSINEDLNFTEIIHQSPLCLSSVACSDGFVRTVLKCYNNQLNLIIRPDDVWAAIITQISSYMKTNPKFQEQFQLLNLSTKLSIKVNKGIQASYDEFITQIAKKVITSFKNPQLAYWVLPNFSTTTEHDIVSIGTTFYSKNKKVNNTFVDESFFGIPWITLEGHKEDWQIIYSRLEQLLPFGLRVWCEMLEKILKQFIQAKNGQIDLSFWQRICNRDAGVAGSYVSGWITTFCIFELQGENLCDSFWCYDKWLKVHGCKLPSGVHELDVTILDEDCIETNFVMLAGHMSFQLFEDGSKLKPNIGWTIALKLGTESVEENVKQF